jgi:hypothetical protein
MTELLTYLIQSDLFEVSYHNEKFQVMRAEMATVIYFNDKKIYLDLWDYSTPTFTGEVFNANFDLILKLQIRNATPEQFEAECQKHNFCLDVDAEKRKLFYDKIVPWTFFCSRNMRQFIGKEDDIKPLPIERLAFFCGKDWRCRKHMKAKILQEGLEYLSSDQELHQKPLSDDELFQKMKSSKYGLIIHGRGGFFCEGKNRREIDYMMLKKPLLLNYKPCYYNPLVEDKHYIYVDTNTNFKDIENHYNIDEIASNGYQWYKDNASPEGVAKTFLQIMKDKFSCI